MSNWVRLSPKPGMVGRGNWLSLMGKVIGNLPEGLTSPNSTRAIAGLPFAEPRHQHRPAGFENHDRMRIGRGDSLDQPVLLAGERKAGNIAAFRHPLLREDEDHVRLLRRLGGC